MPDLDKNYYLDREGLNTLIREFEANIIAYEYDPTVTYSKLDYCIHDNKLYQCFTAITTPKPWDEDDWDVIAIGDVLNKVLQENLTSTGDRPVLLGRSTTNPRLITTYKSDRFLFNNGDEDTPGRLTVYGRGRFIDEATYDMITINDPAGVISGVSNISTYQINGVVVGNNPEFTDTTYTFAGGTNSFTVTPEGGNAQTVSVTPSIANNITGSGTSGKVAAFTGTNTIGDGYSVDTTVTSGSGNLVTSGAVYTAIDNLPEPMVFKGTLGTGGTITTLPTASSSNEGYTYKVITAGTYASQSAKVGDVFVSNGSAWVLIPSGDTDTDTWRNIKINGTEQISSAISSGAVDFVNGTAITAGFNSTGNKVSFSHKTSGVTAGTYKSVTVDAQGHVTAGTNPTTLSGYGITDANIASGVITLGSNTITPLTASSTLDATKLSGTIPSGCYTNTTYTFANGTNGFTVTPSGGTAQTVTVTPSITNNVTGSGTSGYIAKFNGANTITNGPAFGSATNTFLRNDGSWASPATGSDVNVTQTATSTSANYEVLFSATADNTTRTEGARKNSNLTFNPSTGNLQATQLNGVTIGSSPKFTDNNTTYTFANGTNGFTVTPSGGSAQTVTITPSITNNVTGSGTSGYLTKFNGTNTITNGPQLGSSTTTYLNNAGSWATPPDTKNTAGSTNTSSKIFLIGATSQAANPQTYSNSGVWAEGEGNISSYTWSVKNGNFYSRAECYVDAEDRGRINIYDENGIGRIKLTGNSGITLNNSTDNTTIFLDSEEGRVGCDKMSYTNEAVTFSKSSGSWTFNNGEYTRSGQVVQLRLAFKGGGSNVSVGGNSIAGTVNGIPTPSYTIRLQGYYSSTVLMGELTSSGGFNVRILGAALNLSTSNTATLSGTYIVED